MDMVKVQADRMTVLQDQPDLYNHAHGFTTLLQWSLVIAYHIVEIQTSKMN